jgi:hypothetical protein
VVLDDKSLQSALVRSLVVPGELEALRVSAPDAVDWDTVEKFGGFITLVRHNFLWEALPLTRSFLSKSPFELELFTAWRSNHLAARFYRRPDRDAQTAGFVTFTLDFLSTRPSLVWLRDLLVHESVLWTLRGSSEPEDLLSAKPSLRRRPSIRGRLRVLSLSALPSELVARAQCAITDRPPKTSDSHWFVYHVPPGSNELRAVEVDALFAILLSRVDGVRTAMSIARSIAADIPTTTTRAYFEALTREGFVCWRSR